MASPLSCVFFSLKVLGHVPSLTKTLNIVYTVLFIKASQSRGGPSGYGDRRVVSWTHGDLAPWTATPTNTGNYGYK